MIFTHINMFTFLGLKELCSEFVEKMTNSSSKTGDYILFVMDKPYRIMLIPILSMICTIIDKTLHKYIHES